MAQGTFPVNMKLADIIPLFKGGNRHLLTNYRPISLLPTISKLLEKIVYARIYDFVSKRKILYNSQYGFRKRHSCEHAITELVGEISKGLENNKHTIAIFIDLSKAFDTINHNILFAKLYKYGIRGIALDWFKSYLKDRKLRAKCEISNERYTRYSEYYDINIGTPQGSVLGPLIFLLFCNDLYLNLELCKGILFADDTTIYNSHKNLSYLKWTLTQDLEILMDWFKANHLSMNTTKTVGMLFSKENKTIENLVVNDQTIRFVDYTKFLGVWIDKKLNWKEHVNRVCMKLNRNINLLKLGKHFLTTKAKRMLYFAQIQSHLNYGLVIWGNMSSTTWLLRLQKIQNKCVTLINKSATTRSFKDMRILRIKDLITLENCKFGYRLYHGDLPTRIINLTNTDQHGKRLNKQHNYNTRRKNYLNKPLALSRVYKTCIIHIGTGTLETLKLETHNKSNLYSFVHNCKNELWAANY